MTPDEKNRETAREDVESDPGGRGTWAEEGGATPQGPAADAGPDSRDERD